MPRLLTRTWLNNLFEKAVDATAQFRVIRIR